MRRAIVIAVTAVVVVAVVAVGGWAVFEHVDRASKVKDAGKACTGLDVVKGAPSVPSGFAIPGGQRLLEVQSQGKTRIVYASVDGGRPDIVHVRDQVAAALSADGYRVTHTDQEPTYEAEATVTKAGVDDTVNVRPLCSGRLVVRYVLHGS